MEHREFMPQAWQNLVSMRVNLVRRRPLPSEIALDAAAASFRPRDTSAAATGVDTLAPAWRFEIWIRSCFLIQLDRFHCLKVFFLFVFSAKARLPFRRANM